MRIRRGFDLDPSCKLWLPFYKYGLEQAKIYDQSGNNNHGTIVGAVSGTYPMITTPELMPNQVDRDFSGASAWTNVDLNAYNETSDLTIAANAADQYCTCPVASMPTTVGKRYRLYYDIANTAGSWTVKSFDGTQTIGTISANATQGYLDFVASTTGGLRIVAVINTSSGDFDNFSLKEITEYSGLGWYFDGADDYIDCGVGVFPTNIFTLCLWYSDLGTQEGGICGQDGAILRFIIGHNATNNIYVSGTVIFTNAFSTNNPIWKNFILVKNGSAWEYFTNGISSGTATKVATIDDTVNMTIGRHALNYCKKGVIGETLIFNRALSAQEIRNYYELTRHIYGV